jgi:hypothetical protein
LKIFENFSKKSVFFLKNTNFKKNYGSLGVNEKCFIMQKHDELFQSRRAHVKA